MHVSSGHEVVNQVQMLSDHFKLVGSPIMIGGYTGLVLLLCVYYGTKVSLAIVICRGWCWWSIKDTHRCCYRTRTVTENFFLDSSKSIILKLVPSIGTPLYSGHYRIEFPQLDKIVWLWNYPLNEDTLLIMQYNNCFCPLHIECCVILLIL